MSTRADGFYWVRYAGEVQVGRWSNAMGGSWSIATFWEDKPDDEVEVLSERLEPPGQKRAACSEATVSAKEAEQLETIKCWLARQGYRVVPL